MFKTLKLPLIKTAFTILQLTLVGGILFVLFQNQDSNFIFLTVFALSSSLPLFLVGQIPKGAGLFLILAALINVFTWSLGGPQDFGPMDEITHTYTGFAATFFIGFLLLKNIPRLFINYPIFTFISLVSFGVTIGVFWEIYEWGLWFFLPDQHIDSITDTITDLILDGLGAFIATTLLTLNQSFYSD
ncbi:MAG: hypothetical protein C4584_00620 [Armatimonadetes bacterium]|nr:MAG: hypothetical protein C4584_00620 [Armatimonadota bacterium]